jgi:hemolysin activation/secretion protein
MQMNNNNYRFLAAALAGLMSCAMTDLQAMQMSMTLGLVKPVERPESVQDENRFDVLEYRINGNTVLSALAIEEAVYPWMGESKTISDVEKARERLEKNYHDSGYLTVLVDIPEQDVKQGIVRLNVTEGKIDHLRVRGSRYYSLGYIKAQAQSLAEGAVPYFPQVQKEVASLNRTEDRRVTPVMKAGKTFGTVDVDLKVEDNLPLHGSVEMNDQYSKNTERWRLSGMLRYDNLWQRDHSLTLQFQTAPQNTSQVKMLSASYLYRFDNSDRMLAMYAVKSDSNVATFGGINVLGNGTIMGARMVLPLTSLKQFSHSISVGADYKDFQQNILFGADTAKTPIRYLPLSAQYSATSQNETGYTQYALGLNFGLRGLVGKESEFNAKRAGSGSNFMVLKPEVQRTQTLPRDFQLWGKLDGQIANGMLISNEQYVAGGANSVRGYLEAEAAGDNALHASFELRSPALRRGEWLQELRLVGFYDIARLRVINPTATDREQHTIAGTGLGMRLKAQKNWNASLSVARALHDASMTLGDNSGTLSGKVAGHMRLWYEF